MIPQDDPPSPAHIIGASGRSGAALCRALIAEGIAVVPVVREPARWRALGLDPEPRQADIGNTAQLAAALADARYVVSTAHARHTAAVLAAAQAGARFVLMGSTRRYTRFPDAHGADVAAGEAAFLASGRDGVMLHPTMIYGAGGEQNVQRLAAMLRRLPVVPLPGAGRNLVQPIYQDDVTRAVRAALALPWAGPHVIVIAGPEPVTYATLLREVAAAARLARPFVVPVPTGVLLLAARLGIHVPGTPRVSPDEVRRLLEDKTFDIREMLDMLGVRPIPLAAGLARTFQQATIG